jgi:hypothetical protein
MGGFFIALQAGRDWLSLDTTKTGMAHRLRGNPPRARK